MWQCHLVSISVVLADWKAKMSTVIRFLLIYLCLVVPYFTCPSTEMAIWRWIHCGSAPLCCTQGAGMCSTRSGLNWMVMGGGELSTLIELLTEWGACWIPEVFSENCTAFKPSAAQWWLWSVWNMSVTFLKQSRKATFFKAVKKSFDKQHWQLACVPGSASGIFFRLQHICHSHSAVHLVCFCITPTVKLSVTAKSAGLH